MSEELDVRVRSAVEFAERYASPNEHFQVVLFNSRDEWLEGRKGYLGASDAFKILDGEQRRLLFDEMTGARKHDYQGNDLTRRGQAAEPLIRQLIAVENPDWEIFDGGNMIFRSTEFPFASASLDCIAVSRKTGEVVNIELKECQWARKWKGEYCPENYQMQLMHQWAVTRFAPVLHPRIYLTHDDGFTTAFERSYEFDVNDEAFYKQAFDLMDRERDFMEMVRGGKYKPLLTLPSVF